MFIEEIIIDGFKSYATRTVISGFDKRFNAITGMNGSGKSNILDSICFVLGISNLSQVRAGNLQELVYKQGQAGVTKASVTIVFNNSDPKGSPVGYEQYDQITVTRQVVIGGRNKYLINGHTVQASQVQNLFHSVQLNVNNPHFLIMQGRITKVLNMKPPEILGMIEEAAGTRMYENKKQNALKTIEKKQKKVDEITQVLAEEITPTLEKLRQEKSHYLKWTANNLERERLERFCIAYEFVKGEEESKSSLSERNELKEKVDKMQEKLKEVGEREQSNKEKIKELTERKEREVEGSSKALQGREEKLSKELVQVSTMMRNKSEMLRKEEENKEKLEAQLQEAVKEIEAQSKALSSLQKAMEKASCSSSLKTKTLEDLQRELQGLSAGMSSQEEGEKSLADLLAQKEKERKGAAAQQQQAEMRAKHLRESIKKKEKELKKAEAEKNALEKERKALSSALEKFKEKRAKISYSPEEEAELLREKEQLENKILSLRTTVNKLTAQLSSNLNFEFTSPSKNFDRSAVKGVVAKLFQVKDKEWATAIEVTAGGKLYQVVVDTEETGKQLLKNGKLKNRVTIIPLSKISHKTLPEEKVRRAKDIASSLSSSSASVLPALSAVDYEEEVKNAMEYVFGSSFVCERGEEARAITFDKEIKVRTVTKEGDSFDPAGTLQGGSTRGGGSVLLRLQELQERSKELGREEEKKEKILERLEALSSLEKEYSALSQQIDLKQHELELLERKISRSEFAKMEEEREKEREALSLAEEQAARCKEEQERGREEVEALERKIADLNASREEKMASIRNRIQEAKTAASKAAKELKAAQQKLQEKELEIEQQQGEVESIKSQLSALASQLSDLKDEVSALEEKVEKKKEEYEAARGELERKRREIAACDGELKTLLRVEQELGQERSATALSIRKMEHKILVIEKEQASALQYVESMTQKHPWIAQERQFFGRPHTEYDFKARDPQQAARRLKDLQTEQQALSKKINKKVMGMIEKAEQEYQGLMKKKQIIEKDKAKIESVIEELDNKKNEALKSTWEKVNKDFGSIFSTLLPGTQAKLEPPEGGTVLDGLEVKVAFGNVWKESLTELSGGQRSLLALSLILSLLLFKPAPMYILDEVDAALDLSHTQNIGQMIKNHFSSSQFLVVSLKEGMFNNANVLFRTKFVDGVSTVTRTVPNRRDDEEREDVGDGEEENVAPNVTRKKAKKTKSGAVGARGKAKAA